MNQPLLKGIWTRQKWGGVMTAQKCIQLVENKGILGEASYGMMRQITIIERENWEIVMKQLNAQLPPQTRRANLMIQGLNLKETKGKILTIGNCQILIKGETTPCESMDEKLMGLKNALKPHWFGGVYGNIILGGEINIDDTVFFSE